MQRTAVHSIPVYEVRPRKDKRGVDLISDVLPFGRLWYDTPDNAIGYAIHYSRSHDAVIRVYDDARNVIESREHKALGIDRIQLRRYKICDAGLDLCSGVVALRMRSAASSRWSVRHPTVGLRCLRDQTSHCSGPTRQLSANHN